jgi:hypothetical protein
MAVLEVMEEIVTARTAALPERPVVGHERNFANLSESGRLMTLLEGRHSVV